MYLRLCSMYLWLCSMFLRWCSWYMLWLNIRLVKRSVLLTICEAISVSILSSIDNHWLLSAGRQHVVVAEAVVALPHHPQGEVDEVLL